QLVDPHGDGGKTIACLVYAKNDVGGSAPVGSDEVHAIDGRPDPLARPTVKLSPPAPGDANPLHRHADCVSGGWRDDYAALGIPPYEHEYKWYRVKSDGSEELITTATSSEYHFQAEDLGREILCTIKTGNPAGVSVQRSSNKVKVELPTGAVDSDLLLDGGRNGADPTNLPADRHERRSAIH